MSRVNRRVTLSDGRVPGYNEYGPADGKPLSYFHGTPSSHIEWQMSSGERAGYAAESASHLDGSTRNGAL